MAKWGSKYVGKSTSALSPSVSISLIRQFGSDPPGCVWKLSPTLSTGKTGALSRNDGETRSFTVLGGSITWESEEISTSNPALFPLPAIKFSPPLAVCVVLRKDQLQTQSLRSIGTSTITDLNGSSFRENGALDCRVLEYWVLNASLQYSTTPPFHFLKQSFLFQLTRYALVNNIFGFELANLFVASAENTDHVAQTIHIGKNAPVVKNFHHVIARFSVLCLREAQGAHQALNHHWLVLRSI